MMAPKRAHMHSIYHARARTEARAHGSARAVYVEFFVNIRYLFL